MPETLIVVDGREAESQLTHTCTLGLTVNQHLETFTFQVTKLAGWNMILGKTWFKRHNPVIDWTKNTVTFRSEYCQAHYLSTRVPQPTDIPVTTYKIAMISRAAFRLATEQEDSQVFLLAMSSTQEHIDPAKHPHYPGNLVRFQYHNFLTLFTSVKRISRHNPKFKRMSISLILVDSPPFSQSDVSYLGFYLCVFLIPVFPP